MQATITDKLYFYASTVILNVCVLVFAWGLSPLSSAAQEVVEAAPQVTTQSPRKIVSGKPVRIVIESIGVDLPVSDGIYNSANGEWTIGNHKAYYATPTPLVNDYRGTTLIYGHNNRTAFRKLHNLSPSAQLTVYADSGSVFHYKLISSTAVTPTDTSLLAYGGKPQVILQTCSGNWNEQRQLFSFALQSVESATSHV